MAGTFVDRIKQLRANVGSGDLVGKVEVDQIYAKFQHEDFTLRHPRGGGPNYLRGPMFASSAKYLQKVADKVLSEEPEAVDEAMFDDMKDLSNQLHRTAPVDFNNLRRSGHPSVTKHGEVVRDKAPEQHRLTEQEIKAERGFGPNNLGD